MLKSTANSIVPSVTTLFNLSLQRGRIPKGWKQSMIVPIPKNSPANSPKDYRPISLLGILSKVLERHVHSIISQHLAQHHPLSNSQWGFQSGKSTVSALLTTMDSCPVWNPYLKKDIKQLEDVEKFALKMITMQWDLGYQDLLRISDISSLQSRRVQSSLCTLFKIVHGLCYCPPNFVTPRQNYSERTNRQLLLQQPYARTNHHLFSFVPHTVQAWNKLPE